MTYLAATIIFTILLSGSCGRDVRVQQGQNAATKSDAASRLSPKIPPPDPRKYVDIRDGKDWRNPFLAINRDGVSLMVKAVSVNEWKEVPLEKLADTLIALPTEAWPYGRVIGVMESGVRSLNDDESIKRNKAETEKILKSLGLTVNWWPSS
jgi:hypothetical protein